jgi:methionine-rich copper-binding protein CopC
MKTNKLTMTAVALAAGALLAVAAPLSATAHDSLVSSTPEQGQTLTELPAEFSVTAVEPFLTLEDNEAGFALQIVDSAGAYHGDGCVTIDEATLSSVAALGDPGEYTLLWQFVSSDGHPTSGEIAFTWEPSDSHDASVGSAEPPVCSDGDTDSADPIDTGDAHAADDVDHEAAAPTSDALWIGGAITGALVLGLVVFLIVRSRTKKHA